MTTITRVALPGLIAGAPTTGGDRLLVLLSGGRIESVDLASGERGELGCVPVPSLDQGPDPLDFGSARLALHASHSGRYVAVVTDRGTAGGHVVDLHTGRTTMTVRDPSDYYPETVKFSLCFVKHRGRELVAHRTAWNRLDISDAETGELLTGRTTTAADGPQDGELDYFHGGLSASPDGRWILDNGWVWHPIGYPYLIDVERWLEHDVWESEISLAARPLSLRDDWDLGDCWIDGHRLALRSVGDSPVRNAADGVFPEDGFDGVRIVDARDPSSPQPRFAGPRGAFLSDGSRLFSVADGATSVWSLSTGALLESIDAFEPTIVSRRSGFLVEIREHELVVARV